jgi:prepilin-type N-terminal cleavage/methylation domain-containing protein
LLNTAPNAHMTSISSARGVSLIELMVVAGLIGVASAIALPMTTRAVSGARIRGDAQAVTNMVSLAKMRAASGFTRARVFVDLSADSLFLQTWNRETSTWESEGGTVQTSYGVSFGFGGLAEPPPDTQAVIAQSPPCLDDEEEEIGGSACVVFNSRGIPIDADGAPTGANGLYITDGEGVYGTTLTATPLVRLWWSPANTAAWVRQ